jgi:hypothetical protein
VLRPGLARRPGFVPLVLLPLGATLLVPRLPLGLAAVVGACLVARASLAGRALGAAGALVLVGAAAAAGRGAELAFAHAHNLVALALWWTWRPRRPAHQLLPLAAFALGGGAILSGLTLPWTLGATPAGAGLAPLAPGLDVAGFAAAVVPAVGPDWTVRLLVFFAFAQSVHYGVWVRLVPEDDRPRPGLRSFASSYRALRADCGGPLLAAAALIALGVLAAGLLDPAAARDAYLRVAFFHGPLEIAIIALRLVERAAPPS